MRERLRALPLLADVSDAALERLAAEAGELEARAGQTLIERGHPASGLFVLEEGVVAVETPGGEVELRAGDAFGEAALVGGRERRTARVRAKTDARCIAIGRAALDALLGEHPAVAARLRELADARLADLARRSSR